MLNISFNLHALGWETQLLETGFWIIAISPLFRLEKWPSFSTPPLVILAMRWLLFRIMMGAGLIKIRGDACWRDLSCMNYHYQTQPVPNPMSFYLHSLPQAWHMFETAANHVIELVCPILLFCSRDMRHFGAMLQVRSNVP